MIFQTIAPFPQVCFYHVRARELSRERNLFPAELSCLIGCNGKEKCEGINVHRGKTGDPSCCEGFISLREAQSQDCYKKVKVRGMQRRAQEFNGEFQDCVSCQDYYKESKKSCYVNIRDVLSYDEIFHTRSMRKDSEAWVFAV